MQKTNPTTTKKPNKPKTQNKQTKKPTTTKQTKQKNLPKPKQMAKMLRVIVNSKFKFSYTINESLSVEHPDLTFSVFQK